MLTFLSSHFVWNKQQPFLLRKLFDNIQGDWFCMVLHWLRIRTVNPVKIVAPKGLSILQPSSLIASAFATLNGTRGKSSIGLKLAASPAMTCYHLCVKWPHTGTPCSNLHPTICSTNYSHDCNSITNLNRELAQRYPWFRGVPGKTAKSSVSRSCQRSSWSCLRIYLGCSGIQEANNS